MEISMGFLVLLATLIDATAITERVVVPDIAGMIHPLTSSTSRHVQFGDLSSSSPTAYEFVSSSSASIDCSDAQLCMQLQFSSVFTTDPFFLHQYDSKYPVVSATFDTQESTDILPLIPGGEDTTMWWFQSNATETGPVIDLMLRLRQRSQSLSARDQLLLVVKVELIDSHTISTSIETYGVYGNQRVAHTTRRVQDNAVQVALSIEKNADKRDVTPSDAYPLITIATTTTDVLSSTGSSCDICDDFLDACQDFEPCQTVVLPCLITQLKALQDESTPAGSAGDAKEEVDFLEPLATCVADLSLSTWAPLRQALFCFAQFACPFGITQDSDTGDELPTFFRLTNGTQTFVVEPTVPGTDNVDLSVVKTDIRESVMNTETFSYSASVSYLGVYLRSFVLLQAAKVSVLVEPDPADLSTLRVSLTYSDALVLDTLSFLTTTTLTMVENSPPRAIIEYPASLSRPTLDTIIDKLQTRVQSVWDSSWTLDANCISCSADLFGCSPELFKSGACRYNSPSGSFGICIRKELPPSCYAALMTGNKDQRPISAEIDRCMNTIPPSTDKIGAILIASAGLACFSATRCPFGPVALVTDTQMIVLETSSYIQLLRISSNASIDNVSIVINYSVSGQLFAITEPVLASSSEDEIERVIKDALYLTTGIVIGALSSSRSNNGSEWTLEIVYHHVFLPSDFIMEVEVHGGSLKADDIKQVVMEGGSSQLRVVPRDSSKITRKETTSNPPAVTTNTPSTDTTPPSSSTDSPMSRLAELSTIDTCFKCQEALARCQDNDDCAHNQLVAYLRGAMPPAIENEDISGRFDIELTDVLSSLPDDLFNTAEGWHAFIGEIICFSKRLCETGYEGSDSDYKSSFVSVGKIAVIYHLTTFADTKWKVTVAGNEFFYTPEVDVAASLDVAIPAFQHWIKALEVPSTFDLVVRVEDWDGTTISGAGSFDVNFYGGYDGVTGRYTMLAPSLIPEFEVVDSTNTGGPDNIQYTSQILWDIKLWSVGQSPQYDKFLDLLEVGLGGATTTSTPTSTIPSPIQTISSTDPCRKCSSVLARCQQDTECGMLTSNSLIPLLTSTQNGLQLYFQTSVVDDYGTAAFRGDLYPCMVLLKSRPYLTPKAWDLLAGEFYCLAYDSCDMEYSDVYVDDTMDHVPVDLELVRSSINVELRTYPDTTWNIMLNEEYFTYIPDEEVSGSIDDSSLQFQRWLEALGSDDSLNLEIQVPSRVIDADTNTATLGIRIFGSYDDELYQYLMANPMMIPCFTPTEQSVNGADKAPLSEANVTYPSLVISSTSQKPQYSKMLNMLSNGIDSTTTAPTPAPSSTSASRLMFSNDSCRDCEQCITTCRGDPDCLTSSQDSLVPLLREYEMAISTHPETEYGSASVTLSVTALLRLMPSRSAYLTRSGWDNLANELACFAASCDLEYADVTSPFLEYHIPTFLKINEEKVSLSIRTYADTAWTMSLNGDDLSYAPSPSDPMTISDAAAALYEWIESQLSDDPYNLVIDAEEPDIDSVSGVATICMTFHGLPMSSGELMAPPWLIPQFVVAGGTFGGGDTELPVAEANVTPWEISMVSLSQRPQYGKFLDLIAFGLSTPS